MLDEDRREIGHRFRAPASGTDDGLRGIRVAWRLRGEDSVGIRGGYLAARELLGTSRPRARDQIDV